MSSSAHLDVPRRLPCSAQATAQAVQGQCTWTHHNVRLSRYKLKRTSSSSSAHLDAPRRLPFSAQGQAQRTWTHPDVCLSRPNVKLSARGRTTTSAFLGPMSSSAHVDAPRRLPFSAQGQAQRTWTHPDVCLSRPNVKLSAHGRTTTSVFLSTSLSAAHLDAPRRLPFSAQVQGHKSFMLSAPGRTTTSAFLGTSDRTRSSSAAHLEAPRRLPFSAQG
ncbi:hypothetical protein PF003_g17987 [Phytophthora fragariae]|nr:hypothetical protein PF003_g17987 [Phytophthora fragariae]